MKLRRKVSSFGETWSIGSGLIWGEVEGSPARDQDVVRDGEGVWGKRGEENANAALFQSLD